MHAGSRLCGLARLAPPSICSTDERLTPRQARAQIANHPHGALPMRRAALALLLTAAVLGAHAALAHHSPVMFDQAQPVTLTGTVRQFQWTNPHSYIQLVVKNDQGQDEEWNLEMAAPTYLYNLGWRPGDREGRRHADRDRSRRCAKAARADCCSRPRRPTASRSAERRARRHEARRSVEPRACAVRVHAAAAGRSARRTVRQAAELERHLARRRPRARHRRLQHVPAARVPDGTPRRSVERDHDGAAAGGARDEPGAAIGAGRRLGLSA